MAMSFEELDGSTRRFMLLEFDAEQRSTSPYRGRNLTAQGIPASISHIREALESGTEQSLTAALSSEVYWNAVETYTRSGTARTRALNFRQCAERLALTEFNTWYVRGFSRRLLEEGIGQCQVYLASLPKWTECLHAEGQLCEVQVVYAAHRIRYWPEPGDESAFAIPYSPNCRHTIRRYPV
jgi:hypothetical protein